MVDALVLGASGVTHGGSSPLIRTIEYEVVLKSFQTHRDPCYRGLFDWFGWGYLA